VANFLFEGLPTLISRLQVVFMTLGAVGMRYDVVSLRLRIRMDPHFLGSWIRILIRVKSWIRIRIEFKILEL
jgi:hypothetical protein